MRTLNLILLLAPLLGAQQAGMGARLESTDAHGVETPHVKWAKPLHNRPIRILAVPTAHEGRTLAVPAPRLFLEIAAV
jgi:hypothetical protein